MTRDANAFGASDRELKKALRDALARPFDEVDWDRLHKAIIADAEAHFRDASEAAVDRVAAWSSRGIPAAAGALAAAVIALWILPLDRRAAEPAPPGFMPVAEELLSNLPVGTRELLSAGFDVESLLGAVLANGGRERDVT